MIRPALLAHWQRSDIVLSSRSVTRLPENPPLVTPCLQVANSPKSGGCTPAAGLLAALQKARRAFRRAPLFLETDPLAAPPEPSAGESLSELSVWLLCAL